MVGYKELLLHVSSATFAFKNPIIPFTDLMTLPDPPETPVLSLTH